MTTHITKTWFDGEKVVKQEIPEAELYKPSMTKDEALDLALDSLILKAGMTPVMQGSCYVMHPEALQAVIDKAIKQALAAQPAPKSEKKHD